MKKLLTLLLLTFLTSCEKSSHNEDSSSFSTPSDGQYEIVAEYETKSSEDGTVRINFQVKSNTSSFQLITKSESEKIGVLSVISPNNEVIFDGNTFYSDYQTDGKQFQENINTFNFPVTPTTENLQEGTYTVNLKLSSGKGNKIVNSSLITKSDSNKTSGVLTLNVIFAGSIANSEELIKNIKKALNDYTIKTLNKASLAINTNYYSYPNISSILPNPQSGDALYENISGQLPSGINLFMGTDVKNFNSYSGHSGVSASVPGPILPTKKSAIAFSISKAVGNDGEFNGRGYNDINNTEKDEDEGDEVKLFADTISHEIFHYLGLRNSIEFSSNTVVWGDGLNSEKCADKKRCEQVKEARGNVMYPYPILHRSTQEDEHYYWYERNYVSSEQKIVANKWVGVN